MFDNNQITQYIYLTAQSEQKSDFNKTFYCTKNEVFYQTFIQ